MMYYVTAAFDPNQGQGDEKLYVYGKGSYETANTAFIHRLDCTEGVNKLQFCIQPVFLFMKLTKLQK